MAVTATSWKKGHSGNSRGRPRAGEELSAVLRQTVDRERFAEKLCELCYAGDVQAMRLLLAYTDGPAGRAEIENTEGIHITVTYVKQENRIEIAGIAPRAGMGHPTGQAVERALLRAPVGQDTAGEGSADSSSFEG